ncbi:MAG: PEP-CTERM sorting domain-containing protein [Rubrivivax sp.]|nr:PEP-CTERM sorting domain-containing protein [Rubrivivax sp.]
MTHRLHRPLAIALLAAAPLAQAIGITDGRADYVAGYAGSTAGDLDVIGAFVTYNQGTGAFVLSGTMDADIGTTPGGFYVWGANRGAGTAGFSAQGFTNVLFDAVILVRQDGSVTVNRLGGGGSTVLPAGTAHITGATIDVLIPGGLLPSTGFAPAGYTWNLWPRDGNLPGGFGQISDFAPDNSNFGATVIGTVPEPTSALLLAAGIAGLVLRRRLSAR